MTSRRKEAVASGPRVDASSIRRVIHGDNLAALPALPPAFASLVYVDPPFNTGKTQRRTRVRARRAEGEEGRVGFGGQRWHEEVQAPGAGFDDTFEDFEAFLLPRIEAALRCMTPTASLFVHLDAREVHYVKVALDRLLGRRRFMNEIVWAYDFGGRPRNRWPSKHDTILWYALDPARVTFERDAIDRIPYMAPGLVGAAKAARGKTPTDVWWHTIVPTSGKEKTGYPTQKPLGVLQRIVKVHSRPGEVVLDFFAGSGTAAHAAALNDRGFVAIDSSAEAVRVMETRLAAWAPEIVRLTAGSSPAPGA